MPCDSRIQKTQVTDAERLALALEAEGHAVTNRTALQVATRGGLVFSRGREGDTFSLRSGANVSPVLRRYAELGIRQFAKRKGFTIQREEENGTARLTLKRGAR